jgi:hypothetical protein
LWLIVVQLVWLVGTSQATLDNAYHRVRLVATKPSRFGLLTLPEHRHIWIWYVPK